MDGLLTAQISASAIRSNLSAIRSTLSAGTKLCAVVKANCYGHGIGVLLELLSQQADSLAVATAEEALGIRSMGYRGDILILLPNTTSNLDELIRQRITLTIATASEIDRIKPIATKLGITAKVNLKIDSGMRRSGCGIEEVGDIVKAITKSDAIEMTGIYTHFATADDHDQSFTLQQLKTFLHTTITAGIKAGGKIALHSANSAATIHLPQSHLDMVRPGIAIYGYKPSDQLPAKLTLKPALRLVSRLLQIKNIPAGSKCGYGLDYTFDHPSRIGLVPVGYADGISRSLSNKLMVGVAGGYAPVRGRISMDQIIVDLTEIPSARVGDEVEIISPNPDAPNSVKKLAELENTIPYEITCRIGSRANRVLVEKFPCDQHIQ